jgi:small subunit ribosomal protein S6
VAEKVYECMLIFNANAYARSPGAVAESVKQMVETVGGELLASRMWNEQKLSYPIKGQRKGVYWLSYVKMEGTRFPKLNRACQLNETIMRHMIISIDPRLVEPMVAAARGDGPAVLSRVAEIKIADESEEELETDALRDIDAEETIGT